MVTAAVAGAWTAPATAAEDTARWAPAESWMYVGVPNCDTLVESFKGTLAYRATKDPDVKDIMEPMFKIFENLKKVLAEELGLDSPKALEVYPHGGVSVFVTADGTAGDHPVMHIGAVMDMGADLQGATDLIAKITEATLAKGGKKDVTTVAGTKVTTLKFAAAKQDPNSITDSSSQRASDLLEGVMPDPVAAAALEQVLDEAELPEEFAYAFVGTKLLVGSDVDTVSESVKRLNGGREGTLAGSPVARALGKYGAKSPHIELAVNIPQIARQAGQGDEELQRAMRAAGVPALGPWVGTVELSPSKKVDSRLRGYLPIAADRTGIAKLIMMPNLRTAPPATVGSDAVVFSMINLSPATVLAEVMAIADRFDPAEGEKMRANMKVPRPDGTVMDIQKDIVDNLVGPLSGAMVLTKPYDANNVNCFVTVGQKSRDALVSLIGEMGMGLLMPVQMLGHPMYESPMMPGATLGFTERAFILLATKNGAEAYIRGESKADGGLADTRRFKHAAKHVPSEACGVVYSDGPAMFDAQLALHKSGAGANPQNPGGFGMSFPDMIRMFLAESFEMGGVKNPEAIRKYTSLSIGTLTTEADGLRTELVQVVPPPTSGTGE